MKQRGRRSAASMEVNGAQRTGHHIPAPDFLNDEETQIFCEVLSLSPPNHFAAADVFLLATFAQLTAMIRQAAASARKAKPKDRAAAIKQVMEMAKAQAVLCTKLRMAPQSRLGQRTAHRIADNFRPSAYDEMRAKGWDDV
jgi:hypothetical protein